MRALWIPILVVAAMAGQAFDVSACSTFVIETAEGPFVGRNLDEQFGFEFMVVVNKRGVRKQSISYNELFSGQKPPQVPASWVSQYASVTLNGSGAEFPDGGMNETGLILEEMTLMATVYPTDEDRPPMFMQQWVQFVLDTCATLDEVIASAKTVALDGWRWHFMAVDAEGNAAVIEFLDGEAVVLTGDDLPYPLLCNSTYDMELQRVARFEGYGGTETPLTADYPAEGTLRFAKGVLLFDIFDPATAESPVDAVFEMADSMTTLENNLVQKAYDPRKRRMYFRTRDDRTIKWVDLAAFEPGCTTPRMYLSANTDLSGDITDAFKPYTEEAARAALDRLYGSVAKHPAFIKELEDKGTTLDALIQRHLDYPKSTRCICE